MALGTIRGTTCAVQAGGNGTLVDDDYGAADVGYFSDWRTRRWACRCGWTGANTDGVLRCSDDAVETARPSCRLPMARVDRAPGREEVERAAELGNAEAAALLSPEDFGSPYADGRGESRFLTGGEDVV